VVSDTVQDYPKPNAPEDKTDLRGYEAFLYSLRQRPIQNSEARKEAGKYWQHPKSKIELGGLLIVAAYTIISFFLWLAQREANEINARNLVEANRAWLAPSFINLGAPLEGTDIVRFNVKIENTGHQPASHMSWKFNHFLIPHIPEREFPTPEKLASNQTCGALNPANAEDTVFPSNTNYWVPNHFEDPLLVQRILSKASTLVIEGCFGYVTFGKFHTSSFRVFLRDTADKPSCWRNNDGKSECWGFNLLLSGNDAN
jgi:hypothetical protein